MVISKQELIKKILKLNNPKNPFTITSEGDKIKATWNIVDAKWIEIFAKAGMKEHYELTITLNEKNHEVKYNERQGSVTWRAGTPEVSFSASKFSGKTIQFHKSTRYGIKEDMSIGKIYEFDFNTKKVKDPIFEVIETSGWKIKKGFLAKLFGM